MSMRKGQHDICKVCKYFGIGKTKSKRYGERKVKKCYYNSKYGKSLYNLDICPMEKTLFSCGTDSTEIHGIIKGDLTDEEIEDLKCQVEKFMQYAKEKRMKLEKASKDIVKGYRKTKLLRFLDDFIKSDMDCAKVVYERGEYVKPGSCSNALSMAIKRYKYDSIVGVMTRDKAVYLYKKENDNDRD